MSVQEFFLSVLPGFEDLAARELKDWFPDITSKPEHGGVTVEAPLATGLAMNLVLKVPTRILLRLETFRCRDFPKLYRKVEEYPWHEIIDPRTKFSVEVASSRSRLKIKARIAEACERGWSAYQTKRKARPDPERPAMLFVRFNNDECTLSLDTSGDRLHKRGQREHVGIAPLRETIAAALLQLIEKSLPVGEIRDVELVDPMMGSGTFLIEAALRDQAIQARDFAFNSFKHGELKTPVLERKRVLFKTLTGFDKDAKTIQAAEHNLLGLTPEAEIRKTDIFQAAPLPQKAPSHQRWLVANPPYGERLKIKKPLPEYYAELFAACENVARPDRACFILPAKAVKGRLTLPKAWKVLEKRSFSNGGIPVLAFVFGRIDG
jgi:putative N6-adenine-specific DNA methylase